MRNVVLTPHLGSAVVETRDALANAVADNLLALIEGGRAPNICNPEVFDAWRSRRDFTLLAPSERDPPQ
jgi:phosphoglycerate dehydrogenase-like enzyme